MDINLSPQYTLYGDGIHDDYPAIQEMLDSGTAAVLPLPEVCYLVSDTLKIHSGQELRLDRYAHIRLADGANRLMLANDGSGSHNCNITISGGIWDFNCAGQRANPLHVPDPDTGYTYVADPRVREHSPYCGHYPPVWCGSGILFQGVTNLTVSGLTLKDPVNFAFQMANIDYFTIENIVFEFVTGQQYRVGDILTNVTSENPCFWNTDGIHLDGGCRHGVIRNLKGACYDDLLALNADDMLHGCIEDISIDGIFAAGCHSAIRLLSYESPVRNIHITNVHGTYFQYCIGITRYFGTPEDHGCYEGIVLDHIYASMAKRLPKYHLDHQGAYQYPFIWVQSGLDLQSLVIQNVYRNETDVAVPLCGIESGAVIHKLVLEHIVQNNHIGSPIPLLENNGHIGKLLLYDVEVHDDVRLTGSGTIDSVTGF